MNTTSHVFELSIEPVGAPTYRDGFHLGTDESIARRLAEEAFKYRTPKVGTGIRSVALFLGGKLFDCYDGLWASDLHEIFDGDDIIDLPLSTDEANCLADKLHTLMTEANGVDVWLAPGGVLNVNGPDGSTACFLDADEPAHVHLAAILAKLAHWLPATDDADDHGLVVAHPGSISHGTLRHEDLLRTFADSLRNLAAVQPQRNETHLALARDADAMVDRLASDQPFESDEPSELISDLCDALETYSPAGHHFGAHEGDGSDFGWWPNEEEMDGWEEREANARAPFNPDIHAALLVEGFTLTQHEDDFEDDGDAESGPHLTGGPAWDEYQSADEMIVVDHHGAVVHREPRDLEREAYEASMSDPEGAVWVDRTMTVQEALRLPAAERKRIADALSDGTLLFRS